METFNAQVIRDCVARAAVAEAELSPQVAQDVALHMTDWLADLQTFVRFCQSPETFSSGQVNELLIAFLIHVPNHVAAAAKLYVDLPVTDIFSVGSVSHD